MRRKKREGNGVNIIKNTKYMKLSKIYLISRIGFTGNTEIIHVSLRWIRKDF